MLYRVSCFLHVQDNYFLHLCRTITSYMCRTIISYMCRTIISYMCRIIISYMCRTIIGERAKRARHSQVCTIENRRYIMVRAISVYSAGVPYAARFTASRYPWLRSVLKFISIESYLKAILSDYGSNKEY